MSIREEQCNKVCRILDDVLANRPTERDSLIVAVRKAFEALELFGNSEPLPSAQPERELGEWVAYGDIPKECPFCGEDWDKYVFGDVAYTGDLPKFCPNCGRMMKDEQE